MDLINVLIVVTVLPVAAIVAAVLRASRRDDGPPSGGRVAPDDRDLELAVRGLLRGPRPNKVMAIKVVRARTGLRLREAKEYVDALDAQLRAPTAGAPAGRAGRSYAEVSGIVRAVRDAGGSKIEAIRRVRAATGMPLKESKEYVDAHWP